MKTLVTLVLVAAAILATHLVTAAVGNDRPLAVAEADWIPISERLGFVIERRDSAPAGNQLAPPGGLPAEYLPALNGYFVVKTDTGWRRLATTDPPGLLHL